jgi:hypothetical protein
MIYSLAKYKGKWAVYSSISNCYFYIGCGKGFCQKKIIELNKKD